MPWNLFPLYLTVCYRTAGSSLQVHPLVLSGLSALALLRDVLGLSVGSEEEACEFRKAM